MYLQTVETLIRRRRMWRLIWVCTVCQLPFKGPPDYNGLSLLPQPVVVPAGRSKDGYSVAVRLSLHISNCSCSALLVIVLFFVFFFVVVFFFFFFFFFFVLFCFLFVCFFFLFFFFLFFFLFFFFFVFFVVVFFFFFFFFFILFFFR